MGNTDKHSIIVASVDTATAPLWVRLGPLPLLGAPGQRAPQPLACAPQFPAHLLCKLKYPQPREAWGLLRGRGHVIFNGEEPPREAGFSEDTQPPVWFSPPFP